MVLLMPKAAAAASELLSSVKILAASGRDERDRDQHRRLSAGSHLDICRAGDAQERRKRNPCPGVVVFVLGGKVGQIADARPGVPRPQAEAQCGQQPR